MERANSSLGRGAAWGVRTTVGAIALSLLAYVPYRYLTRPPYFEGIAFSLYALLLPVAGLLSLLTILVCLSPEWLRWIEQRESGTARPLRLILGLVGVAWMGVGMACMPSFTLLARTAFPFAALATVQMTLQHLVFGALIMAVAWRPATVRALLEGRWKDALQVPSGRPSDTV